MQKAVLVLLLIICWFGYAFAGTGGTVVGVVLDEQSKPLPGAKVLPLALKFSPHRLLQFHETDAEGRFIIQNLSWGTYSMWAGKADKGYPELPSPFYSQFPPPTVTLQPTSPTGTVTIHLGPKAGAIEAVTAVDAETGREVDGVVTLRRGVGQKTTMEASTTQKPILIPSNTEVWVEVAAPGYKSWPARDAPNEPGKLQLEPEGAVKLEVRLAPNGSATQSVGIFTPARFAPAPNVSAPAEVLGNPILFKEVRGFAVSGAEFSRPLEKLAEDYKVPIGLELSPAGLGNGPSTHVRIEIPTGTVRDVLDSVVSLDSGYVWRDSDFGTINVSPKSHIGTLPDVVVAKYSARDVDREEAIRELVDTPEVRGWMARAGVKWPDSRGLGAPPPGIPSGADARRFSITLAGSSVRRIMNAILIASQSHYWAIYRYGPHGELVALTMAD